MPWEAVAALSALLTTVVIAVTAVIGLIQIAHLRRATPLQSFLQLMGEATSPSMSVWTAYVETVLPECLKDEQYRRELIEGRLDFKKHKGLFLGIFWEKVGALVHHGLIEPEVFIDFIGGLCVHHWALLKEVAMLRRRGQPAAWERFEELARTCEESLRSRDAGLRHAPLSGHQAVDP